MCLTSEEIRNNAEFQTGFLGTGSPDQSNHEVIVRFHQFHQWDRRRAQRVGRYANSPSFISISARQDDRITRENVWGEMVQIGACRNQENKAAVKSSWDWSSGRGWRATESEKYHLK